MTTTLPLSAVRMDGGTQSRVNLDPDTVAAYADAIHGGAVFPPPVVYHDGKDHWLADGFHRLRALLKLARHDVECDVRQGTKRDAILYSVGANATHGLPRRNADKRAAVMALLSDDEWSRKSDRWIAEKTATSHTFVASVRASQLATVASPAPRVGQDGKTRALPQKKTTPVVGAKKSEPMELDDDDGPYETAAEQTARRHNVMRAAGVDPEHFDRVDTEWNWRRLVAMAERNDTAIKESGTLDDLVMRHLLRAYVDHIDGGELISLYESIAQSIFDSEKTRKRGEAKANADAAKAERKAAREAKRAAKGAA